MCSLWEKAWEEHARTGLLLIIYSGSEWTAAELALAYCISLCSKAYSVAAAQCCSGHDVWEGGIIGCPNVSWLSCAARYFCQGQHDKIMCMCRCICAA